MTSNRWNQTRDVNRRPKVCLSKHPIPSGGSPSGPCSITPALTIRTVAPFVFFSLNYRLDSLNDAPGDPSQLQPSDPRLTWTLAPVLYNHLTWGVFFQWTGPSGNYIITLTAPLQSGCDPTTVLDLRVP